MTDSILPVLAAIIHDSRGRVLIARRGKGTARAGYWEFPGGKLKPGETPDSGIRREIAEELQMQIDVIEMAGIVNYVYPDLNILLIAFHCRMLSEPGELLAHDRIDWQDVKGLQTDQFSAADRELIRILQNSDTQFQFTTQ
ncbi:MAG: (deoxy)nucleoside triphosphate pyrophosphohydrolase [Calditrichia bacterium]